MYNTDNVYYFPKNIDVRSCPKNGNSSVKQFFINVSAKIYPDRNLKEEFAHFASARRTPVSWREKQVLDFCDQFDVPFRKDSLRFTIKRDPIERFKSAVEMLQSEVLLNNQMSQNESNISGINKDYKKFYTNIDEILSDLQNNIVVNMHFWTQTHYLGNKSKYDFIYDLTEFEKFQKHVLHACDIKYSPKWYMHINYSNNNLKQIEKIKQNNDATKFIMRQKYFKTLNNDEKITNNITGKQILRIKKLYEIDYDNGWY
jgi:hypothetical protein